MGIVGRYIIFMLLKNIAMSALVIAAVFTFQSLLSQISSGDYPIHQCLTYHLLLLPEIFVQMIPPSVMMGTVLTLAGLNRTNELTACFSIGIGLPQILGMVLSIVLMISCLSLVFQDRVLPFVYRKRTNFYWREMKKKQDFFLDFKQAKIWYRSKNLIYNLKSFDTTTKSIVGMSVYTFDLDFNLIQVIEAQTASFTPKGWRLNDGTLTVFSQTDSFPLTQKFKEKELIINETPKDFQEIEKEVDGLRIKELYHYIKKIGDTGADTKSYEVKLYSRISLSIIPLIMCLLAVPFSVRNRREGGLAKDLGICLFVTFFYWLFYSIGLSLGKNGSLPPLAAASLPTVIFLALAGGLFYQRSRSQ